MRTETVRQRLTGAGLANATTDPTTSSTTPSPLNMNAETAATQSLCHDGQKMTMPTMRRRRTIKGLGAYTKIGRTG